MAMECAAIGFAANLMQLTGTNPVQLILLIWDSAQYASVHKRNCRQFADNLQRMGNLLEPIKDSEYLQAEAVQEPLRKLKDLLFFGFILVDSCKNKNKFIVFTLTWWKRIPKKFSDMEDQIRGLILTCVTLINTNLHINTHSDTAAKLDRILDWIRRMENGKYVDETQVSGAEAVALQGQHQLLIQGLQREKQRMDEMLHAQPDRMQPPPPGAFPSSGSVPSFAPGPQPANSTAEAPIHQPFTESWHSYALRHSDEYHNRHRQPPHASAWHAYGNAAPSHFAHTRSLPSRPAPSDHHLIHARSWHEELANHDQGMAAASTSRSPDWQPSWSPGTGAGESADARLSELYSAAGLLGGRSSTSGNGIVTATYSPHARSRPTFVQRGE